MEQANSLAGLFNISQKEFDVNKVITIVAILFAIFLSGCGDSHSIQISQLNEEVKSLTTTTQELVKIVNIQTKVIQNLDQRMSELESNGIIYEGEDDEEEEDCPPPPPPKKAAPKAEPKKVTTIPPELKARVQEGKLNVVVFKEDWCPHCRRYMTAIKTWDDPNLNFIVIDTSKEPKLAKYKMKNGIPETQLYSGTGQFLAVDSGFSDKENFQKWFNKFQVKKQNTVYINS